MKYLIAMIGLAAGFLAALATILDAIFFVLRLVTYFRWHQWTGSLCDTLPGQFFSSPQLTTFFCARLHSPWPGLDDAHQWLVGSADICLVLLFLLLALAIISLSFLKSATAMD